MTEGRVIIEPYQVMDDFVTEVGRIDQVGPDLYRVLLVSCEPCSIDGSLERVLKAKLFMTSEAMQAIGSELWERNTTGAPRLVAGTAVN